MVQQSAVVLELHVVAADEAEEVGEVGERVSVPHQRLLEPLVPEQYPDAPDHSHRVVVVDAVPECLFA